MAPIWRASPTIHSRSSTRRPRRTTPSATSPPTITSSCGILKVIRHQSQRSLSVQPRTHSSPVRLITRSVYGVSRLPRLKESSILLRLLWQLMILLLLSSLSPRLLHRPFFSTTYEITTSLPLRLSTFELSTLFLPSWPPLSPPAQALLETGQS